VVGDDAVAGCLFPFLEHGVRDRGGGRRECDNHGR
jgi:hypothetical protein